MYLVYTYYNTSEMLTDSQRNFKILKVSSSNILCQNTINHNRFIYRELFAPVSEYICIRLNKLLTLSHASLLQLHKLEYSYNRNGTIEYRTGIIPQDVKIIKIGLYYENYGNTLSQYLKQIGKQLIYRTNPYGQLDSDEIINTFTPIVDVLEYLECHNLPPSQITPLNIVLDDDGKIKYIDQALTYSNNVQRQQNQQKYTIKNIFQIYHKICQIIYDLLVPDCTLKSWKYKVRNLKQKLSKEDYTQFMRIYNKSLHNFTDCHKTKKISKQNKYKKNNKIGKLNKKIQACKQNQVIQ